MNNLPTWVLLFLAAIPSIVFHEVAHGYVANHYGDPTAKQAGRLTLNPIKHVDPFGTILLPLMLAIAHIPAFGYAKPVPVNVSRLRHPRNESVYVSLAGPATNIVLSFLAWCVCRIMVSANWGLTSDLFTFFIYMGIVNITLAVINLLPIPPLDGSALLERLVPKKHLGTYFQFRARALPFAMIALMALIYLGVASQLIRPLQDAWLNLL